MDQQEQCGVSNQDDPNLSNGASYKIKRLQILRLWHPSFNWAYSKYHWNDKPKNENLGNLQGLNRLVWEKRIPKQ